MRKTYDIRFEPWIPWRRQDGSLTWGAVADLVSDLSTNPVLTVDWGRPDFDGALEEFLVGMLSTALAPADEAAWLGLWHEPPSADALEGALRSLPNAFELDGDGARFFQDFTALDFAEVDPKPIDQLLIDSPGDQGISQNKDIFVRRTRYAALGRPAAAMALITMQTYAPGGGQGHRTSMRGGGPLTTLVDPREQHGMPEPLWKKLWANVETREQLLERAAVKPDEDPAKIFPWLAPTRTSEKKGGGATVPAHAHPLQAYFGLPRRIRLDFGAGGTCDYTGRPDDATVVGFRMINYGVEYENWRHPLTSYYRKKESDQTWLPLHGQPGGIVWRDWMALTLEGDSNDALNQAAYTVTHFTKYRSAVSRRFRVHAFGYDMDNMKARGWTNAIVPAFAISDRGVRNGLLALASAVAQATSEAAKHLVDAIKGTRFPKKEDAKGDWGEVRLAPWMETESAFDNLLQDYLSTTESDFKMDELQDTLRRKFLRTLEHAILDLYDRNCPPDTSDWAYLQRRVQQRFGLSMIMRGYWKQGQSLFKALGIALPEKRTSTANRRSTRKAKT